ncbi:hypothetical protein C8R43DRAFT_1145713 [Mycena crocata]|nr:hypothetical protein C8R43DRAFT_1229228 [Mycena crocata]KAJ7183058.1 hypothetical protein C8R43DRAFT_1145713 [Mycena crocata]
MDIPFARKVSNGAIVELQQEIMVRIVETIGRVVESQWGVYGCLASRSAFKTADFSKRALEVETIVRLLGRDYGPSSSQVLYLRRNLSPYIHPTSAYTTHIKFNILQESLFDIQTTHLSLRFSRLSSKKAETPFNNATTMAGRFRFNSRAPLQASNTRHFILEELFDTIYSMLRYKIPVEHKLNSHFPPKFFSFPFNTTTFDHSVVGFHKVSGISAHLRTVEYTTYRVPANRLKSSAAATLNLPRGNNEDSVVRVAGAGQHFSSDNKPPEANASLDLQGDACLR